jgi:hypothetical protein
MLIHDPNPFVCATNHMLTTVFTVIARCLLVLETVAVNLSYSTANQGTCKHASKQKISVNV